MPLFSRKTDSTAASATLNGSVEPVRRVDVAPAGQATYGELKARIHRQLIERIDSRVGRRVDEASPMVDARLADGSRVNAVIAPLALDGPILSIRRFAADPYKMADLIEFGTLPASLAEVIAASVRARLN